MLPEPLRTFKKYPIASLYGMGLLLLLAGGWIWWAKISVDPQRVFWGTIEQGLRTRAVTVESYQQNGGSSLHQTVQYSLGVTNVSHSLTTVRQDKTSIVNELIGTPAADYTRYVRVQTDQKGKGGKPLDFSHILGVWAKGRTGSPQLFSQSVLGVGLPIGGVAVPIGDVQPKIRDKLLQSIQDSVVYQTDYAAAKAKHEHGRLLYVYDVSVQAVGYAQLMQQFAQSMGLHELDSLDPGAFKGQKATKMRLTIDARARHLVAAEIAATGAKQTYTAYDIPAVVTIPKKTVTIQELQSRLGRLQ